MKNWLSILFLAIIGLPCNAQQANFWAYKETNGINFISEPPRNDSTNFTAKNYYYVGQNGQVHYTLDDASVCDNKGNLLFYTNGISLWDKNNALLDTIMTLNRDKNYYPNMDWDIGVNTVQRNKIQVCCLNDSIYYLFNIFRKSSPHTNYNMDMRGDLKLCVIKIINGIPVVTVHDSTILSGNIINITHLKKSDGNYWLILRDSCKYKSIEVTTSSITIKRIAFFYEPNCYREGSSKMITSGNKLNLFVGYNSYFPLAGSGSLDSCEYLINRYDFNILDGTISNPLEIEHKVTKNAMKQIYCLGLSPNDSMLYIGNLTYYTPSGLIYSYFITQKDLTDVNNIKSTDIYHSVQQWTMPINDFQLAYNGRLYFKCENGNLGEITKPDSFPAEKYIQIHFGFLRSNRPSNTSTPSTRSNFPGLDFEYHKLAFRQKTFNCATFLSDNILENISDTSFFKTFRWIINEKDTFTSFNLPYAALGGGQFLIRLTGMTVHGFSVNYSDSITTYSAPKAYFSVSSLQGCQYVAYKFIDSSNATIAIDDSILCLWNFGDGVTKSYNRIRTGSGGVLQHTYITSGIYTVQLIVDNGYCRDTFTFVNNVNILAAPKPGFTVTSGNWCDNPVIVTLKSNTTQNLVRYFFDMGNGDTISSTNQSINYTYRKAGYYLIHQKILGVTGCITQDSLTIIIKIGLTKADTINVLFTTVADSGTTFTKWFALPKAVSYNINNVNTTDTFFTDRSVYPYLSSIHYFVYGIDSCGNKSVVSPVAQTIYLKGENKNENAFALLQYTAYETWKQGVLRYEIEYKNSSNNTWVTLDTTAANLLSFQAKVLPDLSNSNASTAQICYRIKAIEKSGNNQMSVSNIVCVPIYPVVFIPNAFSPNGDGINDYYKPISAGLNDYIFEIYNRWGQLIYSDTPESKGWDGTFQGKPLPVGAYVFRLTAATYLNSSYTNNSRRVEQKGMIYLVR